MNLKNKYSSYLFILLKCSHLLLCCLTCFCCQLLFFQVDMFHLQNSFHSSNWKDYYNQNMKVLNGIICYFIYFTFTFYCTNLYHDAKLVSYLRFSLICCSWFSTSIRRYHRISIFSRNQILKYTSHESSMFRLVETPW